MTIDFGSNLIANEKNYGNHLPVISSNAKASIMDFKISEAVYYYAVPPENYLSEKLPEDRRYGMILRNLYYGIIRG